MYEGLLAIAAASTRLVVAAASNSPMLHDAQMGRGATVCGRQQGGGKRRGGGGKFAGKMPILSLLLEETPLGPSMQKSIGLSARLYIQSDFGVTKQMFRCEAATH